MPQPKKNEAKQDFLKRCTNELVADEDRSADQAYKMCNLAWDNAKSQRAALNFNLPVEFAAKVDSDNNLSESFMITAYTGKPISSWWSDIIIDLDGIETKQKIPVLREHAHDRVVGFGETFADGQNFYVNGKFSSSTDDAREVRDLANEGYPWQASIAVMARKVTVLENAEASASVNGREVSGPMEIWRQSDVGEVSFVSLGRDDDTAAISLTASDEKRPVVIETLAAEDCNININDEEQIMDYSVELLEKEAPELLAEIKDVAAAAGAKEAYTKGVEAERARVMEIMSADADAAQTLLAIKDGTPSDAAYKLFYQAEKDKRATGLQNMADEATAAVETEDPTDVTPPPKTADELRREWRPVMGPAV